jgi:hypothetical protein
LFHFVLALHYRQTPFALPVLRIDYALAEPLLISLVLPALQMLSCCPLCLTCSDAITKSPLPTPLLFGFALSLALAFVSCLILDGANVAVSLPSTIAVAIAVPVAIPDTITIAFPPQQSFLN